MGLTLLMFFVCFVGKYMFIEASRGAIGSKAWLVSEPLTKSSDQCFR